MIDAAVSAVLRGFTAEQRVSFGAALWGLAPTLGRLTADVDEPEAIRRLESLGLAVLGASCGLFGKGKPVPTDHDELERVVFGKLEPDFLAEVTSNLRPERA